VTLPHDDLAVAWRDARLPTAGVHLDTAACSRQSTRVLDAVAQHARHEAEIGGYVAQVAAEPLLRQGRAALGGLLGATADDVAFVESATVALTLLLACWPLGAGATVAAVPGEWGPNLAAFADRGLTLATLPVDGAGRVDLEALPGWLASTRPDLVHVTVVSSHRGVLQPAAEVGSACEQAGVPLVLDVAQALGHVDCDLLTRGADAAYGTSRKWLAGPRGVGFLAVRPGLAGQLVPVAPAASPERWPAAAGLPPAQRLESAEAHVAGRLGLALAAGEHLAAGPERVRARLAALGRMARGLLDGVGGWSVVDPPQEPVAVVTLAPPAGVTVAETRARLLTLGVVTTAAGPERAPREMTGPVLRVSPHVDATVDDLEVLAAALAA